MGCWRIRRKPDTPRPCSCSGMMGDKEVESKSKADPTSTEGRCLVLSALLPVIPIRFPVLRFLGIIITLGGVCARRWKIDWCKSEASRRESSQLWYGVIRYVIGEGPVHRHRAVLYQPYLERIRKAVPLWPRLEFLAAFNSDSCRGQRV